jgi:hypothetical protein
MKTTTYTYASCKCGKELRTPKDGLIYNGAIFFAGPVESGNVPTHPVLPYEGGKAVAICWDCFWKVCPAPQVAELQSYREGPYRD